MQVFLDFHIDKAEEASMASKFLSIGFDYCDFFMDIWKSNTQERVQLFEDNSKFCENFTKLVKGNFFVLVEVETDLFQALDRVANLKWILHIFIIKILCNL